MHGWLGATEKGWADPVIATECHRKARPGYGEVSAHEYLDTPETLALKATFLIKLLMLSQHACVYTGAGISTSAGIGDYATQSEETKAKLPSKKKLRSDVHQSPKSPMLAKPTLAHRVLVAMFKQGLIKRWIQQNHDGLPQKAGLPQHAINEIHGALYDPSNPVVPMSGHLRTDLFEDLGHWASHTDLCLALGTSLSGMNADRVCLDVAARLKAKKWQPDAPPAPPVYGAVIISLQRTEYDKMASLRIYARLDDVFRIIGEQLGILSSLTDDIYTLPHFSAEKNPEEGVYLVPYDQQGFLTTDPDLPKLRWDLREDKRVTLTAGEFEGDEGEVVGFNNEGHVKIRFFHQIGKSGFKAPMERTLGSWWIQSAIEGGVPRLPVINVSE